MFNKGLTPDNRPYHKLAILYVEPTCARLLPAGLSRNELDSLARYK